MLLSFESVPLRDSGTSLRDQSMVKATLGLPAACSQTLSTSTRGTACVAICMIAVWTASKTLRIVCTSTTGLRFLPQNRLLDSELFVRTRCDRLYY
jgi:hypothetical protein